MNIHIGEQYYHYKHKDEEGPLHYRYEIVGFAWDTEREEKSVLYTPLYDDAHLPEAGATVYARPLSVFSEVVTIDGVTTPRFTKIQL